MTKLNEKTQYWLVVSLQVRKKNRTYIDDIHAKHHVEKENEQHMAGESQVSHETGRKFVHLQTHIKRKQKE